MNSYIRVRPLSIWERALSVLMRPISWLVSGAPFERPKGTYLWNRQKLTGAEQFRLDPSLVMRVEGDPNALPSDSIRVHIPLLGGWKKYVVLESRLGDGVWYVGWVYEGECQVSRVPISGPVKMARGASDTCFFGIDRVTGRQIPLKIVAYGYIGGGGAYYLTRFL